jgi:hypothetical protein
LRKKVSTSEALMDYNTVKILVVNKDRQIAEAKKKTYLINGSWLYKPIRRTDVKVLGNKL